MEKKYITWEKYNETIQGISEYFKDKEIDKIVGIYKGGLIPAIQIANILNKPLDIVKFQRYNGNDRQAEYIYKATEGNKILIVDDIIDSGETIEKVLELFENKEMYLTALIIKNKGFERLRKIGLEKYHIPYYEPDENGWIVFPWEV